MYDREYIPDRISELKENEIFVFGSNLAGAHGGGDDLVKCADKCGGNAVVAVDE